MVNLKPLKNLVWVQMLADAPEPGEPGVLAQVLAVGPDAKGVKAGDAVLVSSYCCEPAPSTAHGMGGTDDAAKSKRRMLTDWDIVAKIID